MSDEQPRTGAEGGEGVVASRALVVIDRPADVSASDSRPPADFVTQLIACDRRLPAFRRAGRVGPEVGTRSYRRDAPPSRSELDLVV